MISDIDAVLDSGHVRRWHQHPIMSKHVENLAEHQWKVAVLMHWLDPDASQSDLIAALTHDVGEVIAGDLSPYAKALVGEAHAEVEVRARHDMVQIGSVLRPGHLLRVADKLAAWDFMLRNEPSLRWTEEWQVAVEYVINLGRTVTRDDRVPDLIARRHAELIERRL